MTGDNDERFKSILNNLRGEGILYDDAKYLIEELHIAQQSYEKRLWFLEENAVHLFTTNERKDNYNTKRLCKLTDDTNPILLCQPVHKKTKNEKQRGTKCNFNFFNNNIPT